MIEIWPAVAVQRRVLGTGDEACRKGEWTEKESTEMGKSRAGACHNGGRKRDKRTCTDEEMMEPVMM